MTPPGSAPEWGGRQYGFLKWKQDLFCTLNSSSTHSTARKDLCSVGGHTEELFQTKANNHSGKVSFSEVFPSHERLHS